MSFTWRKLREFSCHNALKEYLTIGSTPAIVYLNCRKKLHENRFKCSSPLNWCKIEVALPNVVFFSAYSFAQIKYARNSTKVHLFTQKCISEAWISSHLPLNTVLNRSSAISYFSLVIIYYDSVTLRSSGPVWESWSWKVPEDLPRTRGRLHHKQVSYIYLLSLRTAKTLVFSRCFAKVSFPSSNLTIL